MGKRVIRLAGAAAATMGVALATTLGTAGTAAASTVPLNHVKLCAGGNYRVFFEAFSKPNWTSPVVAPGSCTGDVSVPDLSPGGSNPDDDIVVIGIYNTSDNKFIIDDKLYKGSQAGLGITAKGTTANGGAGAYVTWW